MDQTNLETPQDAGADGQGVVSRWMLELAASEKSLKDWAKQTKRIIEKFRAEESRVNDKPADTFNILWSNVETLRPALYNSLPKPDVRRRFRDPDPLGKEVAEILKRSLSFGVEQYDFHCMMNGVVLDRLLGGRGVARVRYVPYTRPLPNLDPQAPGSEPSENKAADNNPQATPAEELVYEEVTVELVDWEDFRCSPVKKWQQVTWVAFRHRPTRQQCIDQFGRELGEKIPLQGDVEKVKDEKVASLFKRAEIWEILDKDKRETVWVCPQFRDGPLKVEPDKLKLQAFFDCPRPLYSVDDTHSLVPVPDYVIYESLADELDRVTARIKKLIRAVKVAGAYDSTFSELSTILSRDDNELVGVQNLASQMDAGGDLGKRIWLTPVEKHVTVLMELYRYRESVKASIWEITGIADIMRGVSDASETLGAQQIKANWGSMRIQRSQQEVQRFARDIICLMAEVMSNHFKPETLAMMTGLVYPTQAEKQQIMILAQQAQAMQQQLPPEIMETANKPTWEELIGVMRNDFLRNYKVDIETDSTIAAQLQMEQQNITELLGGIVQFAQGMGPMVQSGVIPMDAAKAILLAAVRRFKLGTEVEDELEKIQQPPPREDPRTQIEQAKLKLKEFETKAKVALEQQRMQQEQASHVMDMQARREEMAHDRTMMQADLAGKAMAAARVSHAPDL